MWLGILIAVASGALMSVQGVFNTELTKQSGIWMAAGFVQLSGFALCLLMWFFTGRHGSVGELFSVNNKFMLLSGVLGALITYTVIKSIELSSPAKAIMIIVTAQLLVAYLIELFGLFGVEKQPFEFKKLCGIVLAIVGFVVFKM